MAKERGRYIVEFNDIPSERQRIFELTVEQRARNFKEVKLGFAKEMAIKEAKRCLSCRKCLGCALCFAECHTKAIDFEQLDQEIELAVDSVILAPRCERFACPTNEKLGHGKYPNVVTAIEFESILSDKGPYGGLVIRPYDGEIPRRIAFVQCFDYQDNHSLPYVAKEILIAKEGGWFGGSSVPFRFGDGRGGTWGVLGQRIQNYALARESANNTRDSRQ